MKSKLQAQHVQNTSPNVGGQCQVVFGMNHPNHSNNLPSLRLPHIKIFTVLNPEQKLLFQVQMGVGNSFSALLAQRISFSCSNE